jgi:26S proteasome regulatory subunit N1
LKYLSLILLLKASLAALALGMVFVGTCNEEVGSVLVQRLMESSDDDLNHTASRFLCLGLGLLYFGKQERADAMLEAVRTVEHKRGRHYSIF